MEITIELSDVAQEIADAIFQEQLFCGTIKASRMLVESPGIFPKRNFTLTKQGEMYMQFLKAKWEEKLYRYDKRNKESGPDNNATDS